MSKRNQTVLTETRVRIVDIKQFIKSMRSISTPTRCKYSHFSDYMAQKSAKIEGVSVTGTPSV